MLDPDHATKPELQWGRDQMIAELALAELARDHPDRFNGAAIR